MWGSKEYSVQKAYLQLSGSSDVHPAFNWIWKSKCQAKHKVFFWLLLHDGLNTHRQLQRKDMALDSYTCELCLHQTTETLRHLFLRYHFAKNCWSAVGALVPTWLRADHATTYLRMVINKTFAMEIIIVMCWSIWKERNTWLFSNEDPSVDGCLSRSKAEFTLVILRAKGHRKSSMK
jgi:hypothetical protein